MTDRDLHADTKADAQQTQAEQDAALKRLKELLLGDECRQINDLQEHLENPALHATDVARTLHEAARISQDEMPGELSDALRPAVENSLYTSVRRDPERLGDALFPVMAPAIRKSIISIMSGMVQSLNHMLENSLSFKGLKWRFEALQTGRSFAEIVMLHTLAYRVEQVFLINKDDGLLLQHVSYSQDEEQNADLVSSMLTAIQDFVRDSFHTDSGDSIDKLSIGNMKVFVEPGSRAVLAAVVRGNAPADFNDLLQERCEAIHRKMADALADFDGDASPFIAIHPDLEACLVSQTASGQGSNSKAWVMIAGVLLLLGSWGVWDWYQLERESALVAAVDVIPGVTVIRSHHDDGVLQIAGMRDPLSDAPGKVVLAHGYSAADVVMNWAPYQSLEPALIERRAQYLLRPNKQTRLVLEDDGVLVVSGMATRSWLERARHMLPALLGVTDLRQDNLVLSDSPEYLLQLAREWLKPPASVRLQMRGTTLVAAGKADRTWLESAPGVIDHIPEIAAFDAAGVTDLQSDGYLLTLARKALKPSSKQRLSVKHGVLAVSGEADGAWIEKAQRFSKTTSGIVAFDDHALVNTSTNAYLMARVRRQLQPPKSVVLRLKGHALMVSGIASASWARRAATRARNIEGVTSFSQQRLVVADTVLASMKQQLASIQLRFVANSSQFLEGEESKLVNVAKLIMTTPDVMALAKGKVQVVGLSRVMSEQGKALALSRARMIKRVLVSNGVPESWIKVNGSRTGDSNWSASLDLSWRALP